MFRGGYKYKLKISSQPFSRLPTQAVYIKVVPGEFDNSLSWPCKEKVRVTLMNQQQPLVSLNDFSGVIDFEKGDEPCSRPLHDNHHEYRFILELNAITLCYVRESTILLRVSRE